MAVRKIDFMVENQSSRLREKLKEYSQYAYRLSEYEQKVYEYIIIKGYRQEDAAKILSITQGAVSSKLSRILERLKFLKIICAFDLTKIDEDLKDILNPIERETLRALAETTCQSETAKRMNLMFNLSGKKAMTQVKIRHKFHKAWDKLRRENKQSYRPYVTLFGYIQDNLYTMHEVKLPQFERGA
jgi:predicted transcriptional regulator